MFQVMYSIPFDQYDDEVKWLKDQMFTFAYRKGYEWQTGKEYHSFGLILTPEQTMMLKLRRRLSSIEPWPKKQRRNTM